jgi:hypothetical protein
MAPIIFSWEHIPNVRENQFHMCFFLYIKLFDANVDAYFSMEPCGISLGTLCVHVFPCASKFNTFGVYLVIGCMLRYEKLMIHSGSWQFFYDIKEYAGHAFPFNISFLTQIYYVACFSTFP